MEPSLPRPRGGFATRAVHGAVAIPEVVQRPAAPAIWPVSTWATDRSTEIGELLSDTVEGYVYGRYDNPTATTLHSVVASLHEAPAAWSLASGTAAIHAALDVLRGDGRILASPELYGGTWALFERNRRRSGWPVDLAPLRTADDLEAAVSDEHTVAYVETIANPSTAVGDLEALASACAARGIALVVDNTFASPYLCQPYTLGATAVIESATKHLGGHGDVVAGVVAGDHDLVAAVREHTLETGASLGPFDAWLVLRGIQTLALRIRQSSTTAARIASILDGDPRVGEVRYPGLSDHPDHRRAAAQFGGRGFGTVLSFDLASRAAAEAFADACEVFVRAVSLGGTHSLVLHPASTTHRQLDAEALAAAGFGAGTVRMSLGVEEPDDLVADLRRGLDAASAAAAGGDADATDTSGTADTAGEG